MVQTIADKVRHLLVNVYQNSLPALKVLWSRLLFVPREALITKLQEILPQLLSAIRTGSSVIIVLYTWIEFEAYDAILKNSCSVAWEEYLMNIDDPHTDSVANTPVRTFKNWTSRR